MHSFKRQIYKFGLIEDNEKNPPTVDDFSVEYQDGVFTFNASHFTNNFQDEDGDSYELIRVTSLPSVGLLKYEGNLIEAGFIFNSENANLLTFELPDSYMTTSTGYCVFEDTIDNIITNEADDGFNLTYYGEGRLEFEKIITSSIPNDTNIYAFFDATSMKIEDAQAAQAALIEWHINYKQVNALYTGDLYILPIVKEDWLDFPNIIWRGSSNRVRNNSDRPNDDFMALAILPPNFDTTSNSDNPNWTSPTELVTLAFIDEVADGTEAYHRNRNGYGFNGQPTSQYFTDYKNFKFNYENNFTFFKGIFYPIADIDAGNFNNIYNACVLQGFGAIEGGATYKLAEIENLGVTFAEERRFHWHLDPTHPYYTGTNLTVANPYSEEANTPVPNTNYNLQGLKDFGWAGVYDKDQPASQVFTSDSFSSDLNKYLEGSTVQTVERKTIYGDCTSVEDICFNFKTSDDSKYLLFSNEAKFCFTGANNPNNIPSITAPTVDSVSKTYDKSTYQLLQSDFTTNFQDADGDSFLEVKILENFFSSKNLPIGKIYNQGVEQTYPITLNLNDVGNYTYELPEGVYVIENRLYKFNNSLSTLISEKENNGFSLLRTEGKTLTFFKLDLTDPQNPTTILDIIEGNEMGDNTICTSFKTSDDSSYKLFSSSQNLCLTMQEDNTKPSVDGKTIDTMQNYTFSSTDFSTNYTDVEGDSLKTVRINNLITNQVGNFSFKGTNLTAPFSFGIVDAPELKYELPSNYIIEGTDVYVYENTMEELEALYPDFNISSSEGVITLSKIDSELSLVYILGEQVITEEECFSFSVSDDNEYPLFSESVNFCLQVPVSQIPIQFNERPSVQGVVLNLDPRVEYTFTLSDFTTAYSDPEGDTYKDIIISSLPNNGSIEIDGVTAVIGDVITISNETLLEEVKYIPDSVNTSQYETEFKFRISDVGSGRYSESAITLISVADSYSIPTVSDNSGNLTDKQFTFAEGSFTLNFSDADGDSYNQVKIEELPEVGQLKLLGNTVQEGTTFLASNSSGLKYTLPDNYAVYSGVLYGFGDSLDSVIQAYNNQGYKLTNNQNGVLTFTDLDNPSDEVKYKGILLDNSQLCVKFTTSDDSSFNAFSDIAEFCLIPQGDINVKDVYINLPPTIGDNRISAKYNEPKLLTKSTFVEDTHPSYSDPEGDAPWYLKVLSLPSDGVLELNGIPVTINQEIIFTDIIDEKFFYIPDATKTDVPNVEFDFTIKDTGSNQYA